MAAQRVMAWATHACGVLAVLLFFAFCVSITEAAATHTPPHRGAVWERVRPQSGHAFQERATAQDGGVFGGWVQDSYAMPAFSFELDELSSPYGTWPSSQSGLRPPFNRTRSDHFYMFGNRRVNAMAVDHGYVQLFMSDRGPMWSNYAEEGSQNIGGGFSYIRYNESVVGDSSECFERSLSTAYIYGPHTNSSRSATPCFSYARHFGVAYYNTSFTDHSTNLSISRTVFAPEGDIPSLVSKVALRNQGSSPITFSHFEFWDVNQWQLVVEWIRTGYAAAPGDERRRAINAQFLQNVEWDESAQALFSNMKSSNGSALPRGEPSRVNEYPPTIFLAPLDKGTVVDSFYSNQTSFFGNGNFSVPQAVQDNISGGLLPWTQAEGQPAALVLRTEVTLPPNGEKTLSFLYGYCADAGAVGTSIARLRSEQVRDASESLDATMKFWQARSANFVAGASKARDGTQEGREQHGISRGRDANTLPTDILHSRRVRGAAQGGNVLRMLQRELPWRSCALQASAVYHEYYGLHVVPQGSAYLYLSGADGAPRDQALFSLALNFLDPSLSKETLSLVLSTQLASTGGFPYSFVGYGEISTALGLHEFPSDLDIFMMMAISEYVIATGDTAFLEEALPFYPSDGSLPPHADGNTVLDHIRASCYHLFSSVGIGPNGLIRIHQGDWDDGIVLTDPDPLAIVFTVANGESIPNSQMAIKTLPMLATLVRSRDETLAVDIENFVAALCDPVKQTLTDQWFPRAWMRDGLDRPYLRGNDQGEGGARRSYIDLEGQPWGLLLNNSQIEPALKANVFSNVDRMLQHDSPIGPRLQQETGLVWPAISHLMTWAYAANDRAASAWETLVKSLYAVHARAFPSVWLGIWGGPDGWVSTTNSSREQPGGTWASPVTPVTDFPVSNQNSDAMFLLAVLRIYGIEPLPDASLLVNLTRSGLDNPAVDFPQLSVSHSGGLVSGTFRAQVSGETTLSIAPPSTFHASDASSCMVGRRSVQCAPAGGVVPLKLSLASSDVSFSVDFSPS